MKENVSKHGLFKNKLTFVLIATGSTVGLGNIWRFPYIAGENGGSAFMLVYLLAIFSIGLPLLIAEIMLGRKARANPYHAIVMTNRENNSSKFWNIIGIMALLSGFLLITFYAVIAGWTLEYMVNFALGKFNKVSSQQVGEMFNAFLSSPSKLLLWDTVMVVLTMLIVGYGVKKGLERHINWMMPGLVLLLLIVLGFAVVKGEFMQGVKFLFTFDAEKVNTSSFLAALGQAFFTLSLGAGAIIAYGAYLPKDVSAGKTGLTVVLSDTFIAIIAGLAIFPLVFANGFSAAEGPGLLFVTLTSAFANMPLGNLFGFLFFGMVAIAALTSSISMIEGSMAFCIEKFDWNRKKSAWILGSLIWLLSLGTVFSFNYMAEAKFFGRTVFENIDFITSSFLMPMGGLFMAFFVGWILPKRISQNELELGKWFGLWFNTIRYITPLLIIVVFVSGLIN